MRSPAPPRPRSKPESVRPGVRLYWGCGTRSWWRQRPAQWPRESAPAPGPPRPGWSGRHRFFWRAAYSAWPAAGRSRAGQPESNSLWCRCRRCSRHPASKRRGRPGVGFCRLPPDTPHRETTSGRPGSRQRRGRPQTRSARPGTWIQRWLRPGPSGRRPARTSWRCKSKKRSARLQSPSPNRPTGRCGAPR